MNSLLRSAFTGLLATAFLSAPAAAAERPKLVLQITVDQLRGDLPTRYYERLGDGGFRYLWESGVVYRNAHHAHANTETIVGHATLATGAHPSHHGMVGNLWFDRESGSITYNVEDARYRLLTAGAETVGPALALLEPGYGRCSGGQVVDEAHGIGVICDHQPVQRSGESYRLPG